MWGQQQYYQSSATTNYVLFIQWLLHHLQVSKTDLEKDHPCLIMVFFFNKTWKEHSLKLTASLPLKIGPLPQISESYNLPSINFQVLLLLLSGPTTGPFKRLNLSSESRKSCSILVCCCRQSTTSSLMTWGKTKEIRAMTSTSILPVGSMGLVYIPNIYHKNQPNIGKWEKQ